MKRIGFLLPATLAIILCTGALFAQGNTIKISDDLRLIKINDNVYVHLSYNTFPDGKRVAANGLVYLDNGQAIIADSPWDNKLTGELIDWLRKNRRVKIKAFFPTHWHQDCMGGLVEVQDRGIEVYISEQTYQIAKAKGIPTAKKRFGGELHLKLDSKKIICYYPGAGHTVDNTVVYIPSEKILFGGCLVKANEAKGLGNTSDADIAAWPNSLRNVLEKFQDCKIVVPGHGAYGDKSLIEHTIKLCEKAR